MAFSGQAVTQALQRVQTRAGHFFSPALVADQFATLESPEGEPRVLTLDATRPVDELARSVVQWLRGNAAASLSSSSGDSA